MNLLKQVRCDVFCEGESMDSILDYLEKTVSLYPEKIAVEDKNETITWKQLEKKAKAIGSLLQEQISHGEGVAIVAEKSVKTLTAMFGVLYAGGFYVAVDPMQPKERLEKIFEVLQPKLLIVETPQPASLQQVDTDCKKMELKEVWEEARKTDEKKLAERRIQITAEDILYGIFTSGSTGTPKGIVVSHRAVMDFIGHFTEIFSFRNTDRIGNQAPFDFDVSVKDIYSSVMTGATLVLIPREMFSTPAVLLDFLCERHITSLTWAVSALTIISSLGGFKYKIPDEVKRVMFSGEVMPIGQLKLWQRALPEAEFVNLYGPSEITCNCTYYKIPEMAEEGKRLPIGKAFPGREVFLLDESRQKITTPGVVGEICSAGESLAIGYYHNSAGTKEKFIFLPDENGESIRCYCTGDLGYFDENGFLYFSGRKDFQIKHMGHRIELEEIEQAMNGLPQLKRSCCLMDEKRNQIVAFYMGDAKGGEIRRELKKQVPVYMIPRKFIYTENFPLNKNGKTDRKYFKELWEETQV